MQRNFPSLRAFRKRKPAPKVKGYRVTHRLSRIFFVQLHASSRCSGSSLSASRHCSANISKRCKWIINHSWLESLQSLEIWICHIHSITRSPYDHKSTVKQHQPLQPSSSALPPVPKNPGVFGTREDQGWPVGDRACCSRRWETLHHG